MKYLGLILTAAALAGLGCSGDDTSGPADGASSSTVAVGPNGSLSFNPANIDVPVNTTVTWNWASSGVVHNVTFQDGTNSGNKSSGSFQRNFSTAGTFAYICSIHGPSMSGTVNVTGTSGQTGGTGTGGGGGAGGGGGGGYP